MTGIVRGALRIALLVVTGVVTGALGACQAEISPESVSATIISAGRFEIEDGLPVLVEPTQTIACQEGVLFGADYRVATQSGQKGRLPIEFRWRHPELAIPARKLWGTESAASPPNPVLTKEGEALVGRALWTLGHPDERVSGRYELQIRTLLGERVLASVHFDLEGC